ncbi:MAG: rhomboid family intramembrane serine protease [Lachnospiraceae bacterium]|nr:rhomboid family intramembrane serine protease [Lachnospiraceae bacterium]
MEYLMDEREYMRECPVTLALVAANAICFIICEFLGGSEDSDVLLRMGAAVTDRILGGEIWRLISCMFLHIGIAHLINNMIVLIALGQYVEPTIGHIKYLILYLVGGLAGSLLSVANDVMRGNTGTLSAGASGAVFALIGAYTVMAMRGKIDNRRLSFGRLAFGVCLAVLPGFYTPGVGVAAHVGGLVAGGILGLILG